MRVYTVHLQRYAPSPDRNAVVVCEGFSWPAFLFGPLWAAAHRLWFAALGLAAAHALILLVAGAIRLDPVGTAAVVGGVAIVTGLCGNDWRRAALAARGWQLAGLAAAADRDAALRRFVDLHPEALESPSPTPAY